MTWSDRSQPNSVEPQCQSPVGDKGRLERCWPTVVSSRPAAPGDAGSVNVGDGRVALDRGEKE